MGFRTGAFAKAWKIENKGNYSVVDLSTSKKNKETGKYDKDFGNKFVRFIGTAHTLASSLHDGASIKLGNVEVTNNYDKEKNKEYTNYLVFSFEIPDGNGSTSTPNTSENKGDGFMNIPDGIDEELPFN